MTDSRHRLMRLRELLGTNELFMTISSAREITTSLRQEKYFDVVGSFIDSPNTNILEFGSWHGSSALSWLTSAANSELVCVDTWLGSWEHWLDTDPYSHFSHKDLELRTGLPSFISSFLQNIVFVGSQERVTPIVNTTANAHQILKRLKIRFDLVYIDAAHDFESVIADLQYATELLKPHGILCGDDYSSWSSVRQAIHEFHQSSDRVLFTGENAWIFLPNTKSGKFKVLIQNLLDLGFEKVERSQSGSSFEINVPAPESRDWASHNYYLVMLYDKFFSRFPKSALVAKRIFVKFLG